MKTGVIAKFEGEYGFLSNFYWGEFPWRQFYFKTAEHAFQAAKGYHIQDSYLQDMVDYMDSVANAPDPAKAKYLGRSVKIDLAGWEQMRVQYMREIIHAKFSNVPDLAGQLLNTGAMLLVEGNDWGDTFWGRSGGKGFNTLGAILMEERGYWLRGHLGDKK